MKDNRDKYLILLIGKSGSGKSTIASHLEHQYGLESVQSYTTRRPRYSNETGHTFVDDDTFDKLFPNMCAYTQFDGYRYGATTQQIDENDIYVIDPAGVCDLVKYYRGDSILVPVYLSTSWIVRFKRMMKRGDGIINTVKRLLNDRKMFNKHISNDGNKYPMNWPDVISVKANNLSAEKLAEYIMCMVQLHILYATKTYRKR